MRIYISTILLLLSFIANAQSLTGLQLLEKAISYHDPNGNWDSFNGTLHITMESPDNPNRDSEIKINLPEEYFYVKSTRDTLITEYTIKDDDCKIRLNGQSEISEAQLKAHSLSCDRATMYKDYYTYLYGLPMKLKDAGTNINETVERKSFKGKEYLVLRVNYDEEVGDDVWYFYFNPETYAMEVYQFFKKDRNDVMKSDSGEYILLSGEEVVNGIKMPKTRAWYYNKEDKYLGTDILKK